MSQQEQPVGPYRAPRRLYLSQDKSRVVEEDDPEAGSLLASEGSEVPEEDVERYQLRALPDPEAKEEPAGAKKGEPEGKAVAGPPEDKASPEPPAVRRSSPREQRDR